MRKLPDEVLLKVRDFIAKNARPLENAIFAKESGKGTIENVLTELSKFQNPDGGFGHGIEPDFRLPDSSAISTSVAMQIMSGFSLNKEHPMVKRAMEYLLNSYNTLHSLWEPVPPSVSEYPRAAWWEWRSAEQCETAWGNPSAELTGYLFEWPNEKFEQIRDELTEKAFKKLKDESTEPEMHELLCYTRMAERLPEGEQDRFYRLLDPLVISAVCRDRDKWTEYNLKPVQVAPAPGSYYHDMLEEEIEQNLDFMMNNIGNDGSWGPSWQWGRFDSDWLKAKSEWMGIITLDNLRILREYGRI